MQCFITEHLLKYRYYELLKSELDMLKIINFNFKNCIRIGSSLSQNDDNSQPEWTLDDISWNSSSPKEL